MGLMQVLASPNDAARMAALRVPWTNIDAGTADLAAKLARTGDLRSALFAYKGATSPTGHASVRNAVNFVLTFPNAPPELTIFFLRQGGLPR